MSAILLSVIAAVALLAGITSYLKRLPCCASRRDLKGQVVLLTGAGGGLGRAVAVELARRGCRLVCVDVAEGPNEETAAMVRQEAGSHDAAVVLTADLRRREDIQQLVQGTIRDLGGIDVLISNAAYTEGGTVCQYSDEVLDSILDVNLKATVQLTRAVLPHMLQRGSGHLVVISSLWGLYPHGDVTLESFIESVRMGLLRDEKGRNISVTVVHPGLFKSYDVLAEEYRYCGLMAPLIKVQSAESVARRTVRAILEREVFVTMPVWVGMLALASRMLPRRLSDLCYRLVRLERTGGPFPYRFRHRVKDVHLLYDILSGCHPLQDPLPMIQRGLEEFVQRGEPLPHDFAPYAAIIRGHYGQAEAVPEAVERFLAAATATPDSGGGSDGGGGGGGGGGSGDGVGGGGGGSDGGSDGGGGDVISERL